MADDREPGSSKDKEKPTSPNHSQFFSKPVTGPHLFISDLYLVYEYGIGIKPVTLRIDEEAEIGTATFALAQDQSTLEASTNRTIRRTEGLHLAARYVEREFGPGKDVDPDREYLTRTSRRRFNMILLHLDRGLTARTPLRRRRLCVGSALMPHLRQACRHLVWIAELDTSQSP